MPGIEAGIGLRVSAGSREALLRAAFDLIDTHTGLRVIRRSLVWTVPAAGPGGADELAAALGVTAELDIPGLGRLLEQLHRRLSVPDGAAPLLLELLWAHDPSGTPDVVAVAPTGPDEPQRPPMPDGRIFLHGDVRLRASACGPLAEVAELARDPLTTRFASEYLKTVPPPLLERPQPFTPAFAFERRAFAGGRVDVLATQGRADMLAAAAEVLCGAPKSAELIGPTTLLPSAAADTRVVLELPRDASLADRLQRWLAAVERAVVDNRLALRRAVVLDDGPTSIHGVLFGAHQHVPIRLGQVRDASASVDPTTGEFRAEISALDPP